MTDRNQPVIWTGTVVAVAALLIVSDWRAMAGDTAAAGPTTSSDWPQWRGPTRDGIAGSGPKLADAWPDGGPKLLWKSEPIPCGCNTDGAGPFGGQEGGLGSVTVVGERAFIYVHWKKKVGSVVITTKELNGFWWREDVPDDFAKQVFAEAQKHDAFHRKPGGTTVPDENPETVVKEFLATLDPKLVEKYGSWVSGRFMFVRKRHPNEVMSWEDLAKVAALSDKEFPTYGDLLNEFKKRGIHPDYPEGVFAGKVDMTGTDLRDHWNTMAYTYSDTIICLDTQTGKELWRKDFPAVLSKEACYVGASGTPAVWDGNVYASGSAGLYCVSATDGSVIWQAKTSFTHSSPLVTKDGVFLMLAEGLTGYDVKTGKILWTQLAIRNKFSSAVQWLNGGTSHLLATGNGLNCVDPTSGVVIWRSNSSIQQEYTPTLCGDIVVCPPSAFTLTPKKGEVLWNRGSTAFDGSTPVIYEGYVFQPGVRYAGAGFCRDVKTGELKWQSNIGGQCTSAIAADGKIFGVYGYPRLIMFKATAERVELLGLGSPTDIAPQGCTPSIANGKLFVRLKDCVACYDITAAGNPVVKPPKTAVVVATPYTTYRYGPPPSCSSKVIWQAASAVDKGDAIEITDKEGKVTTVKKSEIGDVTKPGMTWQIK